jgi:hypothetical protein
VRGVCAAAGAAAASVKPITQMTMFRARMPLERAAGGEVAAEVAATLL